MASKQAQLLHSDIMNNEPKVFKVGNKTFKVGRLNNWVAEKMGRLITEAEIFRSDDSKKTLVNFSTNRRLAPKCISLMVLRSSTRVFLFHWIYWRYLHYKYSQSEYKEFLDNLLADDEQQVFFWNMVLLQGSNILSTQMTKETTQNIIQKHESAQSATL